MQCVKALNN